MRKGFLRASSNALAMPHSLALLGGSPAHPQPWPPWPIWDEREETAVLRALRSGHWGRLTGPEVVAFEQEFAAFQECQYAVATPCGTTALKLALLALGVQAGDEVIVPPYTFVATVGAVIQCNAVPVFVDIHPDSYCLDPARVAEAITPPHSGNYCGSSRRNARGSGCPVCLRSSRDRRCFSCAWECLSRP